MTRDYISTRIESMNAELTDLELRAKRHAALGEPARLAIVERLVLSDASPTELGREFGLSSNLLAHHLGLLEQAGLVTRARSESDHRRTYVHLNHRALIDLVPSGVREAARVVFVCTGNSARSPLAEALWSARSPIPAASAGTEPAERVHPGTVKAARRHGLRLAGSETHSLEQVLRPGDLVVAVCDHAHEHAAPHGGEWLHWAVPDPAPSGTDAAFDAAVAELTDRIDRLVPAVHAPV